MHSSTAGSFRRVVFGILLGVAPTLASAQVITEYPLPAGASLPFVITPGPDDALWFTAYTEIGRIDVGGNITMFELPNPTTVAGITAGPDGNLWFTEPYDSIVGRITTAGVVTEFPIDGQAVPNAITAGPDGRLWFGDQNHRIGAITTDGTVTFYDLPVEQSPWWIAAGPDGNLWFTDGFYGIVSRITTSGDATHFPARRFTSGIAAGPDQTLWMTDMAEPLSGVDRIVRIGTDLTVHERALPFFGTGTRGANGIVFGPDGAAWFTELYANRIGRVTPAGEYQNFAIPTADAYPWSIALGSDGALWFTEQNQGKIGRITVPSFTAEPPTLQTTDGNAIFEPGEACTFAPAWRNNGPAPAGLTSGAVSFVGPGTSWYIVNDGQADYGPIDPASTGVCLSTGDCFDFSVWEAPRPLLHWDAYFTEELSAGMAKTWTLHLGDSFDDVPRNSPFYGFVETLLHNGVTGGCGNASYCPGSPVTRAQMTVFLLRGLHGPDFSPFPASGTMFADVPANAFAAAWIEEAAAEGITAGCGGGNFCPNQFVTRAQMAVLLIRAQHLSGFAPPPAVGVFADVPPGSFAADWIEQTAAEAITVGCGNGNFCPDAFVTREQMAAFLVRTFGLSLYSAN